MARPEWVDGAKCLPIHGRPPSGIDFLSDEPDEVLRAVEFCLTCPVKLECLKDQEKWEAELPHKIELTGVFGGKTAAERMAARKGASD